MAQPFTIAIDPVHPLIRVRLTGFWGTDTVDRYGEALLDTVKRQGARSARPFIILIDARTFPVQSLEVRERFSDLSANWPPIGSGPLRELVIIANSTLSRDMLDKALGGAARIWIDPAQAMSWIDRHLAAGGLSPADAQPNRDGSTA